MNRSIYTLKKSYDETDKKDVAAIGPADSSRSNGTG
jgi:hypothetical protein